MSEIRIVGAVADENSVTFYKENGDTVIIKQGDPRLASLLEKIIPITTRGGIAVVNIDKFSVYSEFQEKTGGFVKFFKAAKNSIKNLLGGGEVEYIDLPPMPDEPKVEATQVAPVATENPTQTMYAPSVPEDDQQVNETEKVSKQVNKINQKVESKKVLMSPVNMDDNHTSDETIVAVIGDVKIPDIDKIKPYIEHALKTNSTIGVENFLKRVASVINKRSHSIADLMRFMERGDLPIADDGSIIAYKKLFKANNETLGEHFVDAHSHKVTQKVGSYVCVDEKLVDPNRNNECSNGLHIGQRSYMSGFSGDAIMLVKLAPEDVITVPEADASKIRAMGYHILFQLPEGGYNRVNTNQALTSDQQAKEILARAIKGDHVARLEEVRVHGQKGNDVVITSLVGENKTTKSKLTKADHSKANVVESSEIINNPESAIKPKDIHKKIKKEVKITEKELKLSNKDKVDALYQTMINEKNLTKKRIEAAKEIQDIKKKSKVSYDKLGINAAQLQIINSILLENLVEPKAEVINNPPTEEGKKVIKKALEQAPKKSEPVDNTPDNSLVVNSKEDIPAMVKIMNDKKHSDNHRIRAAKALMDYKKKKKVGWDRLDISEKDSKLIIQMNK